MLAIEKIEINHLEEPKGIAGSIHIGWKITSEHRNVVQESYQIQISKDGSFKEILYDTGKVESDQSQNVPADIEDMKLESVRCYYVRVRIWDNYGEISTWKQTHFLTALLGERTWKADFITAERLKDRNHSPGTRLWREFEVKKPLKEAFMVASAHGLYQTFLNGSRVGRDELTPGWTSYNRRLLYQTYEVTEQIRQGVNTWSALVGAGWYKGDISYHRVHNFYGDYAAFAGELILRYEDGSEESICTDGGFRGEDSAILFSDIYDGEIYDARLEEDGQIGNESIGTGRGSTEAGQSGTETGQSGTDIGQSGAETGQSGTGLIGRAVRVVEQEPDCLYPQSGSAVQIHEILAVKNVLTTPKGETVLDFGQNISGWVHFQANAKRGETIELVCFETLDSEGNVYTDNLRTAKQRIEYICRGNGAEEYHPHFTFQGFRYVWVKQYPGEISGGLFKALALYSDMEETGVFSCSDPLLNQLQSNILWGLKGNSVDIPSDCPQRDERLGWTGDVQVFCNTACYLMNMHEFYRKWLCDLSADQQESGAVTHVVPDVLKPDQPDNFCGSSGWGDAAVVVPWILYQETGDTTMIRQQYGSMKAWIDFVFAHMEDGIYSFGPQFGDWLGLDAAEGSYHGATPAEVTSAAFMAYVSGLFAKMAGAVGREDDKEKYSRVHDEIVRYFQVRYFRLDGQLRIQTQTAHVLALSFGLVPEKYRQQTAERLVEMLRQREMHLSTGFLGTPFIMHALSENGYLKEAYELLLKKDFPSWLYQVGQGATTVWEHWDGLKPDGSMWSADMNSFNHYAYGSIGKWLYEVCAGLKRDEKQPGYKHFYVEPHPGGDLDYAETTHLSGYGNITVRWEKQVEKMTLEVEIPHNTSASVVLPQDCEILECDGLDFVKKNEKCIADAGSGKYRILYECPS